MRLILLLLLILSIQSQQANASENFETVTATGFLSSASYIPKTASATRVKVKGKGDFKIVSFIKKYGKMKAFNRLNFVIGYEDSNICEISQDLEEIEIAVKFNGEYIVMIGECHETNKGPNLFSMRGKDKDKIIKMFEQNSLIDFSILGVKGEISTKNFNDAFYTTVSEIIK